MNFKACSNVLLVVFDSFSQSDFEALASELPTLNALRQQSLYYTNAYASSPESGPARASLFTGLDIAAHGVWTDGVALPAHEIPFPVRFKLNGYQTWLVGRRQLAGASNWTTEHVRPQEYDHIEWAHGPLHRSRQNAYLTWLEDTEPQTYHEIFPNQPNPDATDIADWQKKAMMDLPDKLSFNTWVGDTTCAQLKEYVGECPFLGIASFVVGEAMGAAPKLGSGTEGLNACALHQADVALDRILKNVPDNTVIVVTAGRGSCSNTDMNQSMTDKALKVPLMIRNKERIAKSIDEVVSTMDIAPTLYDVAKVTSPQRMQGGSLLSDSLRGWALARLRNPTQRHQTTLRAERYKLIMIHGKADENETPLFQLYDLETDPEETQDLVTLPAQQQNLERLIDLMIDARVALEDRTEPRIAKF